MTVKITVVCIYEKEWNLDHVSSGDIRDTCKPENLKSMNTTITSETKFTYYEEKP